MLISMVAAMLSSSSSPVIFAPRSYGERPVAGPRVIPVAQELRSVRDEIDEARDAGQLSATEARRMDREARLIGLTGIRMARDGLTGSEVHELRSRTAALESLLSARRLQGQAPSGH